MLFIGPLFNRNDEKVIFENSKGNAIQNQVNSFQWNCIDGILENEIDDLKIVNVLPVGTYPKYYRKARLESKEWLYNGCCCYEVGSINIPFVKQIQRKRRLIETISKLQDHNIVIYSLYLPFLQAIRKFDKSYKITAIVTDLPEYYDSKKVNILKAILRKINTKRIYAGLNRIDRYVLLTEQMKTPLNVGRKPYVVVEGIAKELPIIDRKDNFPKKRISYTGSLDKKFGIINLINAFSLIKREDVELVICGDGDAKNDILSYAKHDSRVTFCGYVQKMEADRIVRNSTILVNPRQDNEEYTKYSFPSKTMEYLVSGVPIVMYKLSGIPDEYSNYIYVPKDNSVEMLAEAIEHLLNMSSDELLLAGKRAQEFVLREKNRKRQARKILNLMEE